MITAKHEERLISRISGMSELELESLFEELAERLGKDRKLHVISAAVGSEEIKDLKYEVSELEDKVDELESELDDLRSCAQRATVILEEIDEDDDPDKIKSQVDKAIDILS